MEFDVLQVPLVWVGTRRWENFVLRAPDDERLGLMAAEISLPAGVKRRIATVVVEQLELDLCVARAIKQPLSHMPVVRADRTAVPSAIEILPLRRAKCHEKPQRVVVGQSPGLKKVLTQVELVAPTDSNRLSAGCR
jgi:hypothetical protein